MKKKKILYLITQSEFGGAQKYVFDLADNLDRQKYQVEVGVGRPGTEQWLREFEQAGLKVWRLKYVTRQINPWRNILSVFEIYQLIKKTKPGIVHLNSSMIGFTGALAAWIYKIKCQMSRRRQGFGGQANVKCQMLVIYTVHGLILNDPWPFLYKIIFWLFEWLGNLMTDKIICVSHYDKKSVLKFKLAPEKKLRVIHNGIDLKKYKFLNQDKAQEKILFNLKVPRNHKLIGFIGYFYPTKGLSYLIQAARKVVDARNDVNFILIGKGQEKSNLEEIIKKSNLQKKVILAGEILNGSHYLKAFDVFVLPSVKEGLSYTLIEALAAGIPIVTTSVGGNPEIIENNINGIIVPPADPQAMAKAINKILSNLDLAQGLTKNNLNKAKEFGLERMLRQTEAYYTENTKTRKHF